MEWYHLLLSGAVGYTGCFAIKKYLEHRQKKLLGESKLEQTLVNMSSEEVKKGSKIAE